MSDASDIFTEHLVDEEDSKPLADMAVRSDFGSTSPAIREKERVYESEDGQHSADDVDARRLSNTPTVSEVRYYYREGPYGSPVVDKPIEDAFKYGFNVRNDPTNSIRPFLNDYVPVYKDAHQKARRDGFAVIRFQLRDSAAVHQPPENVTDYERIRVLTLDDFTATLPAAAYERTEFDHAQLEVTPNGIVVVDDITHPRHGELLGYSYDTDGHITEDGEQFIHADRCQHIVWRDNVDGDPDEEVWGEYEGDSVLMPALQSMKAIQKGDWGMGQALFRYSAPLYVAETPLEYGEEQFEVVKDEMTNLNMSSEAVAPPGTEVSALDGASEFDPEPFYQVLIHNICAGTMLTKSVLIGSEAGSVGASESDLKNYFNNVETWRQNDVREDFEEAIRMVNSWNKSIMPSLSLGYEIDFEPLFKVDQLDSIEGMFRVVQAASNGVTNYVMTPKEAREFLETQFARFDYDVELGELDEEDMDALDRIAMGVEGKQEPEAKPDGNPRRGQNGGGVERGSTQTSTDPTSQ